MYKFVRGVLVLCFAVILSCRLWAYESNEDILVNRGEPNFVIAVQSNPSTGYAWHVVSYDKNMLQYLGQTYAPPGEQGVLLGTPGMSHLKFKLRNKQNIPMTSTVTLSYHRSWEKNSEGQLRTYTIRLAN